jgi:monoamine oxidase
VDGFGYRTVLADRNAADAIPWVLIEARPEAENRTLVDGMERLPRALAEAFGALGGKIAYRHELGGLARDDADTDGAMRLSFDGQPDVLARRVVLAVPPPALGRIGGDLAPRLAGEALIGSITATPASKLFQVYEGAWWRTDGFAGMRTVSDLPLSKTYYFDFERTAAADGPALLLASYADGANRDAWVALAEPATAEDDAPYDAVERWAAHPASAAQLAAAAEQLSAMHPGITVPAPTRAAFIDWSDGAWHTWNPGVRSDQVMELVVQPRAGMPVWVCNEAFSASQGWVEGALESAQRVLDRLLA